MGSQDREFLRLKHQSERKQIVFPPDDIEDYNQPFNMNELMNALKLCNNTAPGEDNIHYSMLRNLPDISLEFILTFFNQIWSNHVFPSLWRSALTIPFHKPGKDKQNPTSYRPIALTSCLCKLMERMVNTRLVWYLESNKLLHPNQYGFRRNRSTTDILTHIDSYIKTAFAYRQHVVAVFFDLQKAYDTTWKHHILKTLVDFGLKGHLPAFIKNFLSERLIKVKVGNSFSDPFPQYEGVPQGSVLSCSLFAIAINKPPTCMPDYIESSLYVDDFAILTKSASLSSAQRRIQLAVNRAYRWSSAHGFQFFLLKTVSMHFHRRRGVFPPLNISLNNTVIPQVTEVKFLGLLLDPKLWWNAHLRYLRKKCLKTLDLIKCLAHFRWGADRTTLLTIYRALVRSQMDYGCQVYSSASETSLRMLDTIHHLGISLSIGAFRTTPVESLYVESGEPSLSLRRDKLSLQLYTRLLAMPGTPACISVEDNKVDRIILHKTRLPTSLGFRVRHRLLPHQNYPINIMPALSYHTNPYLLSCPQLCEGIPCPDEEAFL